MDIKVEEYVRTKNGLIGKVNKIELAGSGVRFGGEFLTDTIIQFNDGKVYERRVKTQQIFKHSFNLIDLIEVRDIVEYQVNFLSELKVGRVKSYRNARSNKEYLGVEGFDITKIYIKSILTHEQYNANCYKVKGE